MNNDLFSIELEIPDESRIIRFNAPVELREWVDQELSFYSWLEDETLVQQMKQHWEGWRNGMNRIGSYLGRLEDQSITDEQRSKYITNISTLLNNVYKNHIGLTSQDPRAIFAQKLATSDPSAPWVLMAFTRPTEIPMGLHLAVRGLVLATTYSIGMSRDTVSSEKEALGAERDKWQKAVLAMSDEYDVFRKQYTETHRQIENTRKSQAGLFGQFMDDSNKKKVAIEKTYDLELSLRKPVTYWKGKVGQYRKRACWFGISFGAALLVVAIVMNLAVTRLIPGVSTIDSGTLLSWPAIVFVAVATLSLWPLRILSRILLSNVHLAADAEERAVLAQTYLSLLRGEEGLADTDRRLILDTLFRRTATGIVKDDAVPSGAQELIDRFLSGSR